MKFDVKKWAQNNGLNYELGGFSYSFWTHEEKVKDVVWGELHGERVFIFKITIRRPNIAYPAYKTYFNGDYYYDLQYNLIDQCIKKTPEEYQMLGQKLWSAPAREYQEGKAFSELRPMNTFEKVKIGDMKISYGDIAPIGKHTGQLLPLEIIFGLMGYHYLETGLKLEYENVKNFYNSLNEVFFEEEGVVKKIIWKYFKPTSKNVPHDFIECNRELILQKMQSQFGSELSESFLDQYYKIVG